MSLGCSISGCLLSDPPTYRDPEQTPPILLTESADPLTTKIVVIQLDAMQQMTNYDFRVPVRSEDAGDPLVVAFYKNYQSSQKLPESASRPATIPASTLDDLDRFASATLTVDGTDTSSAGCLQLTMVVTHAANFLRQQPDRNDTAQVTWWVDLVAPSSASDDGMVECNNKVTAQ
jgi:hypothetical protein